MRVAIHTHHLQFVATGLGTMWLLLWYTGRTSVTTKPTGYPSLPHPTVHRPSSSNTKAPYSVTCDISTQKLEKLTNY